MTGRLGLPPRPARRWHREVTALGVTALGVTALGVTALGVTALDVTAILPGGALRLRGRGAGPGRDPGANVAPGMGFG